jgi:hypothetical protein
VYVAAGGGGDALAALLLHRTLHGTEAPAVIASYSWDRYIVDPQPGPRSVEDFESLRQLTPITWEITPETQLRWPATPTLPLLARTTDARIVLLDPHAGAAGLRRQIDDLSAVFAASQITLVDVGGDVLAQGDEKELASPLADALALAALAGQRTETRIAIAGPGLDGELPPDYVVGRCHEMDSQLRVGRDAVASLRAAFAEHPSEATALLAAAAIGLVGRAEIRDRGALVDVTADSAVVYLLPTPAALTANKLAQELLTTSSLMEAEAISREVCGQSELDYERRKAASMEPRPELTHEQIVARLARYRITCKAKGATIATLRRVSEVLGYTHYQPNTVRRLLGAAAHEYLPIAHLNRP